MLRNDKVKPIEELTELLDRIRTDKKIVLCHGVFDLLHVGHIRHFEHAKKLGDILVVTLTADRYVNKGPHRPAFPEDLRAESLAALDCVDYVAINRWPLATEPIERLRPHVYVKGSDYKDKDDDRTGGITLEENAVRSIGGELAFTDDITFSASNLINRHLPVFSSEVSDYIAEFSSRHSIDEVTGYLENAKSVSVLVIGEAIIDEYRYCEAIGKSSKEPMLAMRHLSTEKFAGGILAVGNHVASFADSVGLVTFLGTEETQESFVREHLNNEISQTFLYRKDAPTIVKQRFVENYFFTKMLDIYQMSAGTLDADDNARLCATLEESVPRFDAVVVVDFGHGMMSHEAIDIICDKARFLAVNAQSNAGNLGYHTISRYPRADYICMAENEMRLEARDRHSELYGMTEKVARQLNARRASVTRGKHGSLCYSEEEGFVEIPAFAGRVVDRMGAGDAYLSVTSLCLAQDAPIEVAGFIGNAVGAQAVATVGNREPVQRVPLIRHIEHILK
tara:strand:- start:232 stop:1755 length:1524 start_codon:yes stop_codon:yes gene_type:complete